VRDYEVTAEFYDLLQAVSYRKTAERLLDRWLGEPRIGVLDVGAGTGIATALLARRCSVTVHAIEPASSMRTVMLSRLAGRSELLPHVRVHAVPVERLDLSRAADFAICLNTLSTLDATARAEALRALSGLLVPGGRLVVQRPPSEPGPEHGSLPSWCLGGDIYSGDIACTVTGERSLRWRFTYRVARDGVIIRECAETFDGFLTSADEFASELTAAGFTPVDTDDPDVVIAVGDPDRATRPGVERRP
jgi:SAM-dependent methyltransferase